MDKTTADYKSRKKIGQFFTDEELVWKIIELFKLDFNNKIIIEPSCGDGTFIKTIVEKEKSYNRIIGIDTDKKVIEKIKKEKLEKIDLINQDFLKYGTNQKVDMIIGNPPFNLSVSGYWDSTEAFISKSIDMLANGGELILIIPNTVLRNKNYQSIRKKILENTTISGIIDTRGYEFLGADIETIAIYLKKQKTKTQKYMYYTKGNQREIILEKNDRDTILLNNKRIFNSINEKIVGKRVDELFDIKRGNSKTGGLKGRNIDFYDDMYEMDEGNDVFIAIQNIAYRISANVVKGNFKKVTDTVTLLIPKEKKSEEELKYMVNYLNSSIVYYNLHVGCLNESKLTTHIDKYYIDDIIIPFFEKDKNNILQEKIIDIKKSKEISDVRNEFFYNIFNLENTEINEVEKLWVAPKFKLKAGERNGV